MVVEGPLPAHSSQAFRPERDAEIGGGLAAVCWLWRTVRRRNDGLVPWQWITVGLLLVSAIHPHSVNWPNARRGLPTPPVDSAEDVAMIVSAIIALACKCWSV